jgi:hypothetical protein
MHRLASLLPDWMHYLSYQQIERALESFTKGRFISFLQKGYKEAFGEVCRQAYLHGRLYYLLRDVSLDEQSAEVIKEEVKAEVLESTKVRFFAKLRKASSELAIKVDREVEAKNTEVIDDIVADAVVEVACKKMSHPIDDLKRHEEVRQLAKHAIIECLTRVKDKEKLKVVIPKAKGHSHDESCDVNFVYDMASFILLNKR